jgi:hypothetical protein
MDAKQFYKSKRFWLLVGSVLTAVSLIITGEKTTNDVMPELLQLALAIGLGFFGITTNTPIAFGNKIVGRK